MPRSSVMRLGLFNVKYSPNLGDGLLSECLEAELLQSGHDITVEALELAGRSSYGQRAGYRRTALKLLDRSPTMVRHGVVETILGRSLRKRLRPDWNRRLQHLDAVVIGGGNLLGDNDLNFPLKLDAAMAEVRAAGLPAAVFGVGVSDNWSPKGEALFRRALAGPSLIYASVRESRSAAVWRRRLGPAGVMPAAIVHDPGVLVSRHVLRQPASKGQGTRVGLGITDPVALRYHADEKSVSAAAMTAWIIELVQRFHALGWRVELFTNGSPEDDAYLQQLRPALQNMSRGDRITIVPRFQEPRQLASFISGLDLMLAHRLHANIAAYSYGVPHVGFSWDSKLKNFLDRVGRGAFLCTAGQDAPQDAADLAMRAMVEGIDPTRRRTVLDEARTDVASLVRSLRHGLAERGPCRERRETAEAL